MTEIDSDARELLASYLAHDAIASERVDELIAHNPSGCWRLIEIAVSGDLSDSELAYLSAGPFEDLMGRYGDEFIDKIEVAARQNQRMRFLIATVWKGSMSPVIWDKITALRDRLGIVPA